MTMPTNFVAHHSAIFRLIMSKFHLIYHIKRTPLTGTILGPACDDDDKAYEYEL